MGEAAPVTIMPSFVSINPLLKALRPSDVSSPSVTAEEIALAVSNIFVNKLSPVQSALLLYNLSVTGLEQRPDVLAQCATAMRAAASELDSQELRRVIEKKNLSSGNYHGGLCDIVGTGGDGHSTFNISTTSSILASSLLLMAKHGNRASTSKSGSADVLANMKTPVQQPKLEVVVPATLSSIYEKTNYAFLFAQNFHLGMRHVAAVRKEMPNPTIFNLLGPLANPADALIEARVIGVKKTDLVPVFAEALRLSGVKKGMVVCGAEHLDEISCAGETYCARLVLRPNPNATATNGEDENDNDVDIQQFTLSPSDFGLPAHPLSTVSPGLTPEENALILTRLLRNEIPADDPILHFVLMNTAALFVVAGVCDGETSAFGKELDPEGEVMTERGPGDGRWKEGVRLARLAVTTGRAMEMLRGFAEVTNELLSSSTSSSSSLSLSLSSN